MRCSPSHCAPTHQAPAARPPVPGPVVRLHPRLPADSAHLVGVITSPAPDTAVRRSSRPVAGGHLHRDVRLDHPGRGRCPSAVPAVLRRAASRATSRCPPRDPSMRAASSAMCWCTRLARLDNPDLLTIAVVGDGEAETGPLEGSKASRSSTRSMRRSAADPAPQRRQDRRPDRARP